MFCANREEPADVRLVETWELTAEMDTHEAGDVLVVEALEDAAEE
jgi:hypothetical protein